MNWTTHTVYVDTETGEIIPKRQIELKHYVKINYTSTTQIKNHDYGTKTITWKCERNRQTRLF